VLLFMFQSDKRPRSTAQGVPQSTAIWIGLIVIVWLILRQTSFGRHIYAVGGNAEAARRAGINVTGVKIAVFAMASTLTAIAGILQLSRSNAADAAINPTLLLNAIAAAVIGGVSLFGGRGSVWAVVLGALVIGSIENGLNLLNAGQDVKYIVEGVVLLLAVTADALIRRANAVQGR
jgi:D-xylose transport system permease protein